MPARDVDNSLTPGLDTESEEDVSGEDESPQQDELKSEIFRPGEDEDTMPLTNVDRNTTTEKAKDENICGQVSKDISAGVVLVEQAKPVLADQDMPLIRSYSTGIVAVVFVITYKCFPFQHRMSLCRGCCP